MKRFLPILLMMLMASMAFGLIYPEFETISMEAGDHTGVRLFLENESDEKIDVSLRARTDSGFVSAEIIPESVSLNPFERTSVFLEIETETDAPSREFEVEALMEFNGTRQTTVIEVEVSDSWFDNGIEIESFEKTLCRNQEGLLRARIENNSGRAEEVRLYVDSELFLPTIDPDFLELGAGDHEFVEILLSRHSTDLEGDFSIDLLAEFDHSIARKEISFSIKECPEEVEELFDLIVRDRCQEIEKGESEEFSFYIENTSDDEQTIRFALESGLETELNTKNVTLEPREEKRIEFTVTASEEDDFGEHTITIHAFNLEFHASESFCIEMEKFHKTLLSLKENDLVIERNNSAVFELVLENTGDYFEDFEIELEENLEGIELSLEPEEIELEAGESTEIYVNVFVSREASLGEESFSVIVRNHGFLEQELRFRAVKETIAPEPVELELRVYPRELTVENNGTVLLELVIENPSDSDAKDIEIKLQNLPKGATYSRMKIGFIPAGETITISSRIFVPAGISAGIKRIGLMIEGQGFALSKHFDLKITEQEETEDENDSDSTATGLVGLGENLYFGIGLLAVVIILIFIASRHQSQGA